MPGHKLSRLPNEILGSSQLYQAISELTDLLDNNPKHKSSKAKAAKVKDLPESLDYFFRKLPTFNQLADLKNQLEKIIQTAPAIRLTFSDYPNVAFCKQLTDWFRQIHPYCLVEIMIDSTILGGVVIRSSRRVMDRSIRWQLAGAEVKLTGILADA